MKEDRRPTKKNQKNYMNQNFHAYLSPIVLNKVQFELER